MKQPVRVAVTGAAGQIGYALLFRIASGQMLGEDRPIILKLLEIPPAMQALEGVVMELNDCAYPTLAGVEIGDEPAQVFEDADYALLVGAKPRGKGMERKDLLQANAEIFSVQGRALNERASRRVRVLVVGNPANTNALIASQNAPELDTGQFTAMTRLDHNRALAQLAIKTGTQVSDIRRMTIWGNHSSTQYPDIFHATVRNHAAADLVGRDWVKDEFIPTVQQRGAAIINARGASSAASAASAAMDHVRDWMRGTPDGDWVSMGIPSDGSYGIEPGVFYSYPVTCRDGEYAIVHDLDINDFSRERMQHTEKELREERAAVEHLFPGK